MSQNSSTESEFTGLVNPRCIQKPAARVSGEIIGRFQEIQDLSATVADVLDAMGIRGALGASRLFPTMPGRRIIGSAVTVRKIPQRRAATLDAAAGLADMGEIEGANQARSGDVLVIQGLPDVSAMGGLMATMSQRQGALGAIIDGGVRDVGHSRALDFPIWSTHITPVTGKWRSEVAEVNGTVTICGCIVNAGDLVIADETGVVFIPNDRAASVIERVEEINRNEDGFRLALKGNLPLHKLIRMYREAVAKRKGGVE